MNEPMRKIRKRVIVLLTSWILLLVSVFSFLSYINSSIILSPDSRILLSVGWAGYIVPSSQNRERQAVAISASWVVPKVNVSVGDSYSSAWVGIGGVDLPPEKSLIQVGTEHDVVGGEEIYAGWYEMLPGFSNVIENLTVGPGDLVTASVRLIDDPSSTWNLNLTDITNGEGFSRNFVYNSARSSGEWIVERPVVNGQFSALADFGVLTFSNCQIMLANESGAVRNFSYSAVQMIDQQINTLSETQQLNSDGTSFSVIFKQ